MSFLLFILLVISCGSLQKKPLSSDTPRLGTSSQRDASTVGDESNEHRFNPNSSNNAEVNPGTKGSADANDLPPTTDGRNSANGSPSSVQGLDPSDASKVPSSLPPGAGGSAGQQSPSPMTQTLGTNPPDSGGPLAEDGVILRENFESVPVGEIPRWATFDLSKYGRKEIKVVETKALKGTRSLHFIARDSIVYPLPVGSDHIFIKADIMLEDPLGANARNNYMPLIGFHPKGRYDDTSVSPHFLIGGFFHEIGIFRRYDAGPDSGLVGLGPTGWDYAPYRSSNSLKSASSIPANEWGCWVIEADGKNGVFKFKRNDQVLFEINNSSKYQWQRSSYREVPTNWLLENMGFLFIGLQGDFAGDMWIDDLVVSTKELPCG